MIVLESGFPLELVTKKTSPPYGLKMILKIDDILQSATLDLRESNKLDAAIDGKFPDNLVAPSIFTEVMCAARISTCAFR